MAATDIKSLSFSRGVRFIKRSPASNVPKPRQAWLQSQRLAAQMASQIGVRVAEHRSVGRQPAGDNKPGDRGDARPQPLGRAARLETSGTVEKAARISTVRS